MGKQSINLSGFDTEKLGRSVIHNYIILAVKPAFGGLLCYGASSTAFRRKRSDASVYQEHF